MQHYRLRQCLYAPMALLVSVGFIACKDDTAGSDPSLFGGEVKGGGGDAGNTDGRDGSDPGDGNDGADMVDSGYGADVTTRRDADGQDGNDGRDGVDGIDARDGNDGNDGVDGRDGNDGQDGRDGFDVIDGNDGNDGIDGGPDCGNGSCDDQESLWSCPWDCAEGWAPCAFDYCGDFLSQCQESDACMAGFECISTCQDDECATKCTDGLSEQPFILLRRIRECSEEAGCFGTSPQCGDGFCDPSENGKECPVDCEKGCGNGTCSSNETPETCPADCQENPVLVCLQQSCEFELGTCTNTAGCFGINECLQGCGGGQGCQQECYGQAPPKAQNAFASLIECGDSAGCFDNNPVCGDGQCDPGDCPEDCGTTEGSCAGKCGMPFNQNDPCACDNECAQFGDCCQDFQDYCAVDGCGDGYCDPNTESADSCPTDCQSSDPYSCIVQSCGAQQCTQGPNCNKALLCMAACKGADCVQGCVAGAPAQIQNYLAQIGNCALDTCVSGGGEFCGDGVCQDGEPEQYCQDCFVCGDGFCSEPWEPQYCPDDCQTMGSCKGKCGEFSSSSICQCDEMCVMFGNCCADYKDYCGGSTCGDGQCSDGEVFFCPSDCQTTPWQCVSTNCEFGSCPNFMGCSAGLSCMESCGADTGCLENCVAKAPPQAQSALKQIYSCGADHNCYESNPGPVCGNGVCEEGEWIDSCPMDCLPKPPICGDGQCVDGESSASCPKDCGPPVDPSVCIYEGCSKAIDGCVTDFDCVTGLQCFAKCSGDASCIKQSCLVSADGTIPSPMLFEVYECALNQQCIQ